MQLNAGFTPAQRLFQCIINPIMTDLYERVSEIKNKGERAALCIVVRTSGSTPRRVGSKMLVFPDGSIEDTIGGGEVEQRVIQEALKAMQDGKARMLSYKMDDPAQGDPGVCGGQMEVYVEAIIPQAAVIVIGAGHVGKAVIELAHWLGFHTIVCDDRPGFAQAEQNPDADQRFELPMTQLAEKLTLHNQSYVVLTTRSVDVDVEILPSLLASEAAYIGVIGSRRRWQTTQKALLEKGIKEGKLAQVYSPVGLELNAETPQEIAISIMAQIVKLRGE